MVFTTLNLAQRLNGWEQSRAVLDFNFTMQPPGWMLQKAATAGVKFEREKFDALNKSVKYKLSRYIGGEYILMYRDGHLKIGPPPPSQSPHRSQVTYREEVEEPICPAKPQMLVKTAAGAFNKNATQAVEAYNAAMDAYLSEMN